MSYLQQELYNNAASLSTGLVLGGKVTVNAGDNTKFDVAKGVYIYIDNSNPEKSETLIIRWDAFIAVTPVFIATSESSFIGIDTAGVVAQKEDDFTQSDKRVFARLAGLGHPDNTTISVVDFTPGNISFNTGISFNDFIFTVRPMNFLGNEFDVDSGLAFQKVQAKHLGMDLTSKLTLKALISRLT
jgi:hypothetical protein